MTFNMIFITVVYLGILMLFAYYSYLNVKQTKTIEDWNEKTDLEIKVLKERNLALEKRVAKLEHDLGESVIEPEPEFKAEVKK